MKITLSDIANRVGVSKSLVSMYLNNHPLAANIAGKTKRKIDAVVAETGYKPSFAALALASGKSRTLGMVVGGLDNSYFANLANAALNETASYGYQMQLAVTRWNREEEKKCLDNLLERRPEGIIYCPRLDPESSQYQMFRDTNYPVVILEADDPVISNVGSLVDDAMLQAVRTLKARGHKRISAYLFCLDAVHPREPWTVAFLAACRAEGVEPDLRPLASSDNRIVDEILSERLPALLFQEPKAVPLLLAKTGEIPQYRPDIIVGYCAFDKFIRHPGVVGGIFSQSEKIVGSAVQTLIRWAEKGKEKETLRIRFPASYVPAEEIPAEHALCCVLYSPTGK